MSDRVKYLESLQRERASVDHGPDSPEKTQRLAHIDAVIDRYAEKPQTRRIESRKS